ncbi:hypothetical protein Pst134EA_027936 [Puccinia striiformis f. sp. tritici]|uniref:Uncharacterized protein n=1 Tax=Puccinia striiformis f. sp. tritici PST-78 TaxID=1165861 RepID=A0A0L0UTN8_9BASI|nr:hypothetical protein Pst134EA_027936 [Puccinia striiformis f. sp. tritici]KAH9448635.1 hypothetical protein Pst134EA_027936 [Puccinia striiformis f. sp. tritici]KAI9616110.1 hypothetical protein KEM48_005367 [Puccinia striiformis f. sp. tritici PST-130]KNE90437.1 hypothetical protein PSTG_16104 [Puccinia striiformis f. sp. tritici PST-78]
MVSQASLNTVQTGNQQPAAQNPQDVFSPQTLAALEAIVLRWEQRLREEIIQDEHDSVSANQLAAFNLEVQQILNQLDLAESSLDVIVNQMFQTRIHTVNPSPQ